MSAQHTPPSTQAPPVGLACVLCGISGTPAGWQAAPHARRGSFLVLVVGTLALLAVLTIVYVSLGNQDARTKSAVDKRELLDSVPRDFSQYVAKIIADDVLATHQDGYTPDPTSTQFWRLRETTDIPGVRWDVLSNDTAIINPLDRFEPVGQVPLDALPPDNTPATVIAPSDPWLASTKPVHIDFLNLGPTDATRPWLDDLDWYSITNIAPDGAFVNLVNLRPNPADLMSGFDARSDAMRRDLTLLERSGNNVISSTNADFAVTADPDLPAFWTMRQQLAFRPARPGPSDLPDSPEYRSYQWVDADGDGMLDSRIFEMVDGNDMPGQFRQVLTFPGKYRWFFAARIVDLCALVNVNTATDLLAPPRPDMPLGVSPADVDLRRILTMTDVYNQAGPSAPGTGGYAQLFPTDLNYRWYDEAQAADSGHYGYLGLRLALAAGETPAREGPDGQAWSGMGLIVGMGAKLGFAQATGLDQPAVEGRWKLGAYDPLYPYPNAWPADNNPPFPVTRDRFYQVQKQRVGGDGYNAPLVAGAPGSMDVRPGFGLADLAELLTRRGQNDPNVTTALERAVGARDTLGVGVGPTTPVVAPEFLDPLRSNRTLAEERAALAQWIDDPSGPQQGGDIAAGPNTPRSQALLLLNNEPRQFLTALSAAREFRSVRAKEDGTPLDPLRLDDNELKANARELFSNPAANMPALFRAYADGLAGLRYPDAWKIGAAGQKDRTLFYGQRGPELAMLTAAHMTVNLKDMLDTDDRPTGATLILDQTSVGGGGLVGIDRFNTPDTRLITWANFDDPAANGAPATRLEVPGELNLDPGAFATSPVVNVFGVEPQPFISQVVTMTVYADITPSMGVGDSTDAGAAGPIGFRTTIPPDDSTAGNNNDELLYRLVAFTITNPFDQDIELSRPLFADAINPPIGSLGLAFSPGEEVDVGFPPVGPPIPADTMADFFYIEFGGRRFMLSQLRERTFTAASTGVPGQPELVDPAQAGSYAEPFYPLRAPITTSPIKIKAGETIVCYAMSTDPYSVYQDLQARDPSIFPPPLPNKAVVERIITDKLGRGGTGFDGFYWIPEIDYTTGSLIVPGKDRFRNVIPPDPAATSETRAVTLWRALRTEEERTGSGPNLLPVSVPFPGQFWTFAGTPGGSFELPPRNLYNNDQLVDRFRIPNLGAAVLRLDARLNPTFPQPYHSVQNSDAALGDDSGFTITLWSLARRPADSRPNLTPNLTGELPAWCIEPKYYTSWNSGDESSLVVSATGAGQLDESDFKTLPTGDWAMQNPREWVTAMSRLPIEPKLIHSPSQYALDTSLAQIDTARVGAASGGTPNVTFADLVPQVKSELQAPAAATPPIPNERPPLRLADLLLPLGVGPMDSPFDNTGAVRPSYYNFLGGTGEPIPTNFTAFNKRYTTLGESLAIALGYESNTIAGDYDNDPALLADPIPPATVTKLPQVDSTSRGDPADILLFDRGNLWLDRFVPFEDNSPTNPAQFDPSGGTPDIALGNQIPLALQILDNFSTTSLAPATLPVNSPAGATRVSLTRPTPGLINLNTAPVEVLRTLPLLSPPINSDAASGPLSFNSNPDYNWYNDLSLGGAAPMSIFGDPPPPAAASVVVPEHAVDIAATIVAYRDKTPLNARPISDDYMNGTTPPIVPHTGSPVNGANFSDPTPHTNVENLWMDRTRGLTSGVEALSELVGLRSPAEVFLARIREPDPAMADPFGTASPRAIGLNGRYPDTWALPCNVDTLAYDNVLWDTDQASGGGPRESSFAGLSPIGKALPAVGSSSGDPSVARDSAANSYDEKLAIANAVLAQTTTRSDVFACWFVVMGFEESDVADLQPSDPMTPSVQRRFLMVIDRSNVLTKGDKPRILLFKEVPL